MGSYISIPRKQPPSSSPSPCPSPPCSKKQCLFLGGTSQLIPGIPDEISIQILARIPRRHFLPLQLVSRGWHDAFISNELFEIRKSRGLCEEWLYMLIRDDEENLSWHAVDPVSGNWQRLPPMPGIDPIVDTEEERYIQRWWPYSNLNFGEILKSWFGGKDAIDKPTLCGCVAGCADGCLYVLGGLWGGQAIRTVWCYDPRTNDWKETAPMGCPRAYCKTAVLHNKLYALGGVNKGLGGIIPLQSAEVYDPSSDSWRPIPSMPFAKAQTLPAMMFANRLRPIATGAASFGGKLCVPQSLYSWPFFVDVGGELFDPSSESWIEMPRGMGEGWPVREAGAKLSVVVNENLYALDPTNALDGSKIKMYDVGEDSWKVVFAKVPIILDFSESESPYLLAGVKGGLHVVSRSIDDSIIVLRAETEDASSSSSSATSSSTVCSHSVTTDTGGWKFIAKKKFGSFELVTCQVLAS